jgi:hypothetical protein
VARPLEGLENLAQEVRGVMAKTCDVSKRKEIERLFTPVKNSGARTYEKPPADYG